MPTIIRTATPSDAAWITERHATHYAVNDGFDETFGPLVADILEQFFASHDPARERGWIAMQDDTRDSALVGSIFCVSGPEGTAKLRLFYLEPHMRGSGLGQALLDTCLTFAKHASYAKMRLWTHESHRAAGRLYARNGFALIHSAPVQSFGQSLVTQTWERPL